MARVGIDLDGVVYDFVDAYRQQLVSVSVPLLTKPGITRETRFLEPTRWEFYLDWGICQEDFLDDLKHFDSIFSKGKPYPGAEAYLCRLIDAGHTIVFITDRSINPRSEQITRKWIADKMPDVAEMKYELHITADKASIPVDYFIDDKPENVRAVREAGRAEAYLCDRPWNMCEPMFAMTLEEFVDLVIRRDVPIIKSSQKSNENGTIVTSPTGGQKGKKLARFDLIPPRAMVRVAEIYGKGAEKYADWNWRKGYDWSLSLAALERHLNAFKDGESLHEDGHHLASVVFHALALMTFEEEHPELDDRFKRESA